jgi:hypothetical protein
VTLTFRSAIGAIELAVQLDFADERLHFEPLLMNIGASRASIEHVKEESAAVRFHYAILANGHLELWDQDAQKRLGRTDSYIPQNMMINSEWFTQRIAELEALIGGESRS